MPHRSSIKLSTRKQCKSSFMLLFLFNIVAKNNAISRLTTPSFISSTHITHNSKLTTLSMIKENTRRKRRIVTIEDLTKDPSSFSSGTDSIASQKKKSKRTRQKVTNPKQSYLYASQRKKNDTDVSISNHHENVLEARKMGLVNLNHPLQCCDAIMGEEPKIVAEISVLEEGEEEEDVGTTNAFAYLIDKPVGWTILPGKKDKRQKSSEPKTVVDDEIAINDKDTDKDTTGDRNSKTARVKVIDYNPDNHDEEEDFLEYNMEDILEAMTPEEKKELEMEGGLDALALTEADLAAAMAAEEMDDDMNEEMIAARAMEAKLQAEMEAMQKLPTKPVSRPQSLPIATSEATFAPPQRPSIMSWLKQIKAEQNAPIRGGKYWTALAGATNVHDSGLVLLCPKNKLHSLQIHSTTYVAIVGNQQKIASQVKKPKHTPPSEVSVVLKWRKNRIQDPILATQFTYKDDYTTCDSVVYAAQQQFQDGIRGDPNADPLDKRAPRRLIHCQRMSISTPTRQTIQSSSFSLPDDITIYSRPKSLKFVSTRQQLFNNTSTTAYREMNGAADGFPGWIFDRYGQYLWIQQQSSISDSTMPPLPSIHDGKTKGIYLLESTTSDRSKQAAVGATKPELYQGASAPTPLTIYENNIRYLVDFNHLSTGLFLDQRSQRAWLRQNCVPQTRVLNCFAHCGGFSIAAAVAGAQTVSLDLEKKWLDRIEGQMELNGVDGWDDDVMHDKIYGDCFDWLQRLSKRNELFDIVILDPPSTSVGKKKKRWSVKNDCDELVELAKPLVKPGGLLWTMNNCATVSPLKFARMCWKGLGQKGWKLERVLGMPADFPCIGSAPVTNLVWRRDGRKK